MKTPATMYCEQCGALMEADSMFCAQCGNKLHDTPAKQSQIQSEPTPREDGRRSTIISTPLAVLGICILVVLVGSLLFSVVYKSSSAPASKELTRGKAQSLMEAAWKGWANEKCSGSMPLNNLLQEPELVALKGTPICQLNLDVIGIRMLSQTEAQVQAKIRFRPDKSGMEAWIAAIDRLQRRLVAGASIEKGSRPSSWPGNRERLDYYWTIKLVNGRVETVNCAFGHPGYSEAGFHNTIECSNASREEVFLHAPTGSLLSQIIQQMNKAKDERVDEHTANSNLQLWDDGWRVMSFN